MAMLTTTNWIEPRKGRPFITLTYTQSLDGSIAARPSTALSLSGAAAMTFTHHLRAMHDAILVGIGTVLTNNPALTVRYVPGVNPRPVILDSLLNCPPTARFLDVTRRPIVATTRRADVVRRRELEALGAQVLYLPAERENAARVNLHALLAHLHAESISSLMVEGGARVITSFLRARLVDRIVITIVPTLVGGVRGVTDLLSDTQHFPRLRNAAIEKLGDDWIAAGEIVWD